MIKDDNCWSRQSLLSSDPRTEFTDIKTRKGKYISNPEERAIVMILTTTADMSNFLCYNIGISSVSYEYMELE